jgi:hypothetical protein
MHGGHLKATDINLGVINMLPGGIYLLNPSPGPNSKTSASVYDIKKITQVKGQYGTQSGMGWEYLQYR